MNYNWTELWVVSSCDNRTIKPSKQCGNVESIEYVINDLFYFDSWVYLLINYLLIGEVFISADGVSFLIW